MAAPLDALKESADAAGAILEPRTNAQLRQVLPELAGSAGGGLFHREAGTVLAGAAMRALRLAATNAGVELFAPERVTAIEVGDRAVVTTDGRRLEADRVVIAAGPWTGGLLQPLRISPPLAPAIAQVTFLDAPLMVGRPGVAEWPEPGTAGVYGHPVPGVGYKIAFDAGSDGWDPDAREWVADPEEERRMLDQALG